MILIYSDKITPRLEYTFGLIFTHILKVETELTNEKEYFLSSDLPKINYSPEKFENGIYLKPHGLLQQSSLIKPDLKPVTFKGENFIFPTSADSFLPFDAFAASFFLVTRFEEYLDSEKDHFGRFRFERSIAREMNWLKKPVVNIWAGLIASKIRETYPEMLFPVRKPEYISTIDVDNAWAYLHKGFWRTFASLLKAMLKNKSKEFSERIKVLKGKLKDPYDTFGYLNRIFAENENKVLFFFLTGNYGKYDKNISPGNQYFKHLIKTTSSRYKIGIHPSFASASEKSSGILIKEKMRLEKISEKKIIRSRQHYIRLSFPETYQKLLKSGIVSDYSMGYPNQTGFRAGICTPYPFYDLAAEKVTSLMIFPFQIMDVTLLDYMNLNPDMAWKEIELLMNEVKNAGGTFVSIWHNESLNNHGKWKGYRDVFEKMNQSGFSWSK